MLKKHWPGVLLVPDVCSLQNLPPDADMVAAGFPCIDISRAGLKQGLAGGSSGLVGHVFRLLRRAIQDGRPINWVLLENVEALLDRAGGRQPAVKAITDELEELGYSSWCHRVICSAGFGLPNRRKRVFILASLHGDARDVLLAQGRAKCLGSCTSGNRVDPSPCYECYQPPIKSVKSIPAADMPGPSSSSAPINVDLEDVDLSDCALALDLGNARSAPGIDIMPTFTTMNDRLVLILPTGKIGLLRTDDAERLQGLPTGHTRPCWPIVGPGVQQHRPKQAKDSDKDSIGRARFALIGNAVTVDVARWLGLRLADPYAHKYIMSSEDCLLPASLMGPGGGPSLKEREDQNEVRLATQAVIVRQSNKKPLVIFHLPGMNGSEEGDADEGAWDASDENMEKSVEPMDLEGRGKGTMDQKMLLQKPATQEPQKEKADEDEMEIDDERTLYGGASKSANDGTWPRAAWFLKGHGRYAVHGVSENPIKLPFRPLGEIIKEVGAAPSPEALTVFIQRLREQGWNLAPTIRRIKECGANLDPQVLSVVRLVDQTMDSEKLGKLIWAKDPSRELGAWWPAELFDPWNLPPGVGIRSDQILGLKLRERSLFLPTWILHPGQKPPEAVDEALDEADEEKGDEIERQVEAARAPKGRRKLLIVFFGDKRESHWEWSDCVLDFREHRESKVAEMEGLIEGRMVNCGSLFRRALYHADQAQGLKQQMGLGEVGVDGKTRGISSKQATMAFTSGASHAMAAMQAALINKQARCDQCEACLASNGPNGQKVRRRCLVIRASAAAASGHTGAQLAALGRKCIGARISVWWPLDEKWYSGFVTDYDSRRVRHQILYDDNEYELICLWAPGQLVGVLNNQSEWDKEAERIEKEGGERRQRQLNEREEKSKADDEGQEVEVRTDAEVERANRIRENRLVLAQMNEKVGRAHGRAEDGPDGRAGVDEPAAEGAAEGEKRKNERKRARLIELEPSADLGGEEKRCLPAKIPRELRGLY